MCMSRNYVVCSRRERERISFPVSGFDSNSRGAARALPSHLPRVVSKSEIIALNTGGPISLGREKKKKETGFRRLPNSGVIHRGTGWAGL